MVERYPDLESVAFELRRRGRLPPGLPLVPLAGGVSGLVGLVADTTPPFVVKTARRRLTVADDWYADPARSLREGAILTALAGRLGPMRVPRILFTEPDLNLIGMEAILPIRPTWREDLLMGVVVPAVAVDLGRAMAALHRLEPPAMLKGAEGMALFTELRVEPYYLHVASVRPDLAQDMARCAEEVLHPRRPTLVHGDVTPKNVLCADGMNVLLDFEVIHWGEPAFDPAMLFAHFAIKSIFGRDRERAQQVAALIGLAWQAYQDAAGPASEAQVVRHMGAIMLARLAGKSRVLYLEDPRERAIAERVALSLRPPCGLAEVPGLIVASL
jgi:5-methylthioribose kinase